MNKKIFQIVPSIVLYICAGLLTVFAIWAFMNCADVISQARAAGQLASTGNEYDIVSFYMSSCGQYFIFALLLASAGLLLQKSKHVKDEPNAAAYPVKNNTADAELDEWFNEESAANNTDN